MNKTKTNNLDGLYLTDAQLSMLFNLGKSTCRKIADEAQAVIKIGKSRRTNRQIFEQYLIENYSA